MDHLYDSLTDDEKYILFKKIADEHYRHLHICYLCYCDCGEIDFRLCLGCEKIVCYECLDGAQFCTNCAKKKKCDACGEDGKQVYPCWEELSPSDTHHACIDCKKTLSFVYIGRTASYEGNTLYRLDGTKKNYCSLDKPCNFCDNNDIITLYECADEKCEKYVCDRCKKTKESTIKSVIWSNFTYWCPKHYPNDNSHLVQN